MKRYLSLLLVLALLISVFPAISVSAVDQELASVSVSSDKWLLLPGETAQLTASALNAAGESIENATFEYMSMDTSVASVDDKGLITALAYGVIEVLVKATVGDVTIPKLVRMTVAEPTDRYDFEMAPGSVTDFFASGSIMAEVSDEAGKDSAMSAKLHDTSTKSAALLRVESRKTESLKLVFDVLPKNGSVQFRVSNGGRGTANTAFWIQITTNQVKYYDGNQVKWLNLGSAYNSIAGKWTSVRVEATVDDVAEVYINDQFIGAVPRTEGDYGKSATNMIDSIVFECGDAGTTGSMYYLDNVKLSPVTGTAGETFDKMDLNATPEAVPGHVDSNAAVIKTAPGAGSNNVLKLMGSKDNEAVPFFDYSFDAAQKASIEFQVYLDTANTVVSFQTYSGTRAFSNSVFCLQFNHLYGLRVYNGKWTAINGSVRLKEKEWNKVRLDVTAGDNAQAKIYLNGEHIATTSVAYNKKASVNGLHIFTGTKEQSCYIDNLKIKTPVDESFDKMELTASADVLENCIESHAAIIKADPLRKGEKALHMSDPSSAKTPIFLYTFEESAKLDMEFEVYIPTTNNSITFQLVNGSRATGKTAFWMQFNYAYGLRAYNGKAWQEAMNADAKLKVGQWNKVRLEVTAGENAEVTVYLNGENVGTTQTTCSTQDVINGINIFPGAANMSCYLDNLKVTAAPRMETVHPEPVVEGFEISAGEAYAPAAAVSTISSSYAAIIKADPAKAGQAMYLSDSKAADYPNFHYSFGATSQLTLEYDAYLPNAGTALTFQILDGARSNTNTAFWLQFSGAGLRVYNGAWSVVNADAKLTANSWNKIRMDITTGANGSVKFFVNGEEVGTTNIMMNQKATVNGMYLFLGNKTHSCYIDNLKVSATPITQTFEELDEGADLANTFAATTLLATVGVKDGNKFADLHDTVGSSTAQLRYVGAAAGELELSFDVVPVSGDVLFRFSNGARTNSNLAFWLKIKGGNQVQYYAKNAAGSGAWQNLGSTFEHVAGEWISVQAKASLTTGKAEIYINGQLMGEAKRCDVGGYGANVSTAMDSVIFAAGGGGTATGGRFYVDNLKLVKNSSEAETFEDVELQYVSSSSVNGYVADYSTAIKTEPGAENKALYLSDSTAADYPNFHYTFAPSNALALEFDVYPTDAGNAITFQILNGARSTANTAFWMQFSGMGLRVFDGSSWATVNADAKLTANKWNKIRIDLTVGAESEAKISVGGKVVGTTQVACKPQTSVDGLYLFLGNKTHSCYIDNLKATPAPAGGDFEEMTVGAAPTAPFVDANLAVVSSDKAYNSGKSVYMADTIAEQTSLLRLAGEKSANLTLEFAMLPTTGSVQFRLLNGARNTANTGFWINFTNKAVGGVYYTFLQYYDGSKWVEAYQFDGTLAGKWHTVRVEAAAGKTAAVIVDGKLLAEVPTAGGSYGSNAKTALDGVVFECGDSKYATWKFYLDDIYLSSSVGENFDSLKQNAVPNFKSAYAAVVKPAPGVKTNKILHLVGSNSNTTAPSFQYSFGNSYDKISVGFDVYPMASNNTTSFQIYNGTKAQANTAFWLSFGPLGLRAYNGSWNVINADAKLTDNAWNKIRVEVVAGEASEAKIYLDDTLVGTTTVFCTQQDVVNGINIMAGAKEQSCYIDNLALAQPSYEQEVTPEPVDLNFEDVELKASVESLMGCVAQNATTVTADPLNAKNEVLLLKDADGQATPYLDYSFASNSKITLEFDAYIPTAGNSFAFQIYDTNKAYSNTVFFLQFNHDSGLRVYNGSWSVVNADAKLNAGKWNKIRVEMTAGEKAEAQIYLNDKAVGTTQVAYNNKSVVNGFYIFAGSAAQSVYIDNLKITAPKTTTFSGLAVNESPATVPGYVAHTAAAIKSDPGVNKALYLYDSTGKSVPFFDYAFDTYSELKLDFDAYVTSSSDVLTFRLYQGSKADVNTAFVLQLDPVNGLRVNNGEWTAVNADAKLAVKKWNKIHIEAVAGANAEATISINGKVVGTTKLALNQKDAISGIYFCTEGATQRCYIDNVKAAGVIAEGLASDGKELLITQIGDLFDIADNTEREGLPVDDPIIKEDFRASFGEFGFTQIPNTVYDPATGKVYINYNRHRDTIVDHPFDSTRVYDLDTILNAKAGDQLQTEYVDMITEDTMFFGAMLKLNDGKMFFQNYPTYYLTDTTSTTYSWIVNTDGSWEKVEGVLTLPADMCYEGPQPTTTWGRYGFTRCLVELDDGTLLGAMYGSYGAVMVESKDLGKTWNYRSTIADSALGLDEPYVNTDGTDITWFEPGITRCADGSLLCVLRTWRNKPLWQCRSYDDGLTWTKPTLMPGMEGKSIFPHLQLLSNGVLAMATGVPGDTIYFSLDGCGYNWDYSITTYSGDTTGNSAITEVAYDEATGTVTLLNVGDKGFNNLKLSGVWGKLVTVTRTHVEDPKLSNAVIRCDDIRMAPGESIDVYVEAVFNSDSQIIGEGYNVEWYSLTPVVASVDANGKVTAKDVGTAEIQAVVSYEGKTVMSNKITVEIREREVLDYLEITPTQWTLKPGQDGRLTCEAFNYFGQEFVSKIRREDFINGDVNEPKFILGDVQWSFESLNPELLEVDPVTGDYRALNWGVVDLQVTATKDDVTLTEKVTMIIESDQWVMEDFESGKLHEGTIVTDCISISDAWSWSGKYAMYLNDDSTTLTPTIRYPLPESRGIILEFMLFSDSMEHSATFGIGAPREDGLYNYLCNTVYIGLLNNPHTHAQGFQSFNGISWSYSNRANNIPHRKWNKVRLEVTTDEAKFYVNGKLLHTAEAAADRELLNTLFFGSGGAAYTGDAMYIDDIRYMTFDEKAPSMTLTEQELVHEDEQFFVENTFFFLDVEGVDFSKDAGILVWTPSQFAGRKVEYTETFAIPGLVDAGNGYYTARSKAIDSGLLGEGAYYAGYVKLADGTYVYTDAQLYTPSAVQLNFIASAQNVFVPGVTKSDLTNAKLTNAQKEIQWVNLGRQLEIKKDMLNKNLSDEQKQANWDQCVAYMNLAAEIPADMQVEKDTNVFIKTGKTLKIADKISLVAVYDIKADVMAGAKEYGTIFWTAEQFATVNGIPGLYNYGEGTVVKMEAYGAKADLWASVGPQLKLEEMADGEFYMLGYVVDANGNVSYSGVESYTVEQYIKNMVEDADTTPEMMELAKRLLAYERELRVK